jgi:hypothetical protein
MKERRKIEPRGKNPRGGRPPAGENTIDRHIAAAEKDVQEMGDARIERQALIALGRAAVNVGINLAGLTEKINIVNRRAGLRDIGERTVKGYFYEPNIEKKTVTRVARALGYSMPIVRALLSELNANDMREGESPAINDERPNFWGSLYGEISRSAKFGPRTHEVFRGHIQSLGLDARRRIFRRYILASNGLDCGSFVLLLGRVFGSVEDELVKLRNEGCVPPPGSQYRLPGDSLLGMLCDENLFDHRNEAITAFLWMCNVAGLEGCDQAVISLILTSRLGGSREINTEEIMLRIGEDEEARERIRSAGDDWPNNAADNLVFNSNALAVIKSAYAKYCKDVKRQAVDQGP